MLSREKGLITKEYIVTHMLLNFAFNRALHISTSAIKINVLRLVSNEEWLKHPLLL